MNIPATTNLYLASLLSVACLINREVALNLGRCHSYCSTVSFEEARNFLSAINGSPFLDCLSAEQEIVSAMLQVESCPEGVDVVVDCVNEFWLVCMFGYSLIFGPKANRTTSVARARSA